MFYAFTLGNNKALSIAEILSVLKRDHFVFVIFSISTNSLIIKTDKEIENPQDLLNRLGGTIKIIHIFGESNSKNLPDLIINFVKENFKEQKFIFGISFYNFYLPRLGFEIKKKLKETRINSRLILGKQKELSAPEIKNNKVLSHGADFAVIKTEKEILLGNTIAIQDYEDYSHRDYDRPRRNAKSGMLPPKLAQIMINMIPSLENPSKTNIFDPFCGNGTVLQEALLNGYQVIGSDISNERVFDTKENLKWLEEEYDLDLNLKDRIFALDALELKQESLPIKPDIIVSEVYLGPPMHGNESSREISTIVDSLNKKYRDFITNTSLSLKNVKYLILAIPVFISKNQRYYLNIIDEAKKVGYNVISPIEDSGVSFGSLPEYNKDRKTFTYYRQDQMVGREIIILKKK